MKLRWIVLAGVAGFLGYVAPTPDRVLSGPGFRLVATADAIVGRPITPVSYAGVARRTAVRRVLNAVSLKR